MDGDDLGRRVATPPVVARGRKVALRRARAADRDIVYRWLTDSDLTPRLMGGPLYPDVPVMSEAEFDRAFGPWLFDGTRPFDGRGFLLQTDDGEIGFIAYDRINLLRDIVEIDIWLAHSRHSSQGFGSEALMLLCEHLQRQFGVNRFLLRPSRRNVRALRAMRRAGFREADLPVAQMLARLDLRPGRYFDEVLLMRSLSLPRALLAPQQGQALVFLDSEFTSLESPRLISVGAVTDDEQAFYCELDQSPAAPGCSDFVRSTVLPLLEGGGVTADQARDSFVAWLHDLAARAPVTLVSDSGFDRWALTELLGSEDLPPGVQWVRVPVAYEALDEVAVSLGLRRHHALDDARALRHAVLHPER